MSSPTSTSSSGGPSDIKGTIARTFDEAAGSYDTIGPEYFARFGRRLVELADVRSGMRVLDVGCGAGDVSMLAADLVGLRGRPSGTTRRPTDSLAGLGRHLALFRRELAWRTVSRGEDAWYPREHPSPVDQRPRIALTEAGRRATDLQGRQHVVTV